MLLLVSSFSSTACFFFSSSLGVPFAPGRTGVFFSMPARCSEPISLPVGGSGLLFRTMSGLAALEAVANVQRVVVVLLGFPCPCFSPRFFRQCNSCLFPPPLPPAPPTPPLPASPLLDRPVSNFWVRWGMNSGSFSWWRAWTDWTPSSRPLTCKEGELERRG